MKNHQELRHFAPSIKKWRPIHSRGGRKGPPPVLKGLMTIQKFKFKPIFMIIWHLEVWPADPLTSRSILRFPFLAKKMRRALWIKKKFEIFLKIFPFLPSPSGKQGLTKFFFEKFRKFVDFLGFQNSPNELLRSNQVTLTTSYGQTVQHRRVFKHSTDS